MADFLDDDASSSAVQRASVSLDHNVDTRCLVFHSPYARAETGLKEVVVLSQVEADKLKEEAALETSSSSSSSSISSSEGEHDDSRVDNEQHRDSSGTTDHVRQHHHHVHHSHGHHSHGSFVYHGKHFALSTFKKSALGGGQQHHHHHHHEGPLSPVAVAADLDEKRSYDLTPVASDGGEHPISSDRGGRRYSDGYHTRKLHGRASRSLASKKGMSVESESSTAAGTTLKNVVTFSGISAHEYDTSQSYGSDVDSYMTSEPNNTKSNLLSSTLSNGIVRRKFKKKRRDIGINRFSMVSVDERNHEGNRLSTSSHTVGDIEKIHHRFHSHASRDRSVDVTECSTIDQLNTRHHVRNYTPNQDANISYSKEIQRSGYSSDSEPSAHESDEAEVEFCLVGSKEHRRALEERIRELTKEKETQLMHMTSMTAEIAVLANDLEAIADLADTNDKSVRQEPHHSTHSFGFVPIETTERIKDTKLFKRPELRQYWDGSILRREREERKTSWTELFMDLAFVIVVGVLGHLLTEHFSWRSLHRYVLTFIPLRQVWSDIHLVINLFWHDDILQKMFIYAMMCLVVFMGINAEASFNDTNDTFVVCYFVARLLVVFHLLIYSFFLPNFSHSLRFLGAVMFTSSLPWAISCIVANEFKRFSLWWLGITLENILGTLSRLLYERVYKPRYRIAFNIEHHAERLGLFTILGLGESVVGVLFKGNVGHIHEQYISAALGLLLALNYQWVYYDSEGSLTYVHAMRRSRWAGFFWGLIHLPLHISMIAGGAAMGVVVTASAGAACNLTRRSPEDKNCELTSGKRFLFCAAWGIAMLCMAIIGILHKSLDKMHQTHFTKTRRIGMRILVAGIMFILPLAGDSLSSIVLMAIMAGMTSVVVFAEVYGGLAVQKRHYLAVKASLSQSSEDKNRRPSVTSDNVLVNLRNTSNRIRKISEDGLVDDNNYSIPLSKLTPERATLAATAISDIKARVDTKKPRN